jgi:uncharacterized membrane protein YqiK
MMSLTIVRLFSAVVFVLILMAAAGVFSPKAEVTVVAEEEVMIVSHTFVDYPPAPKPESAYDFPVEITVSF